MTGSIRRAVVEAARRSPWLGIPVFVAERTVWRARWLWDATPRDTYPREALDQVGRDGIAVVPGYLDGPRCEVLRAEVDRVLEAEPRYVHRRADLRVYGAERVSAPIRAVHEHAELLALAQAYNRHPVVNGFTLASRLTHTPGLRGGSGPGWHRDHWFQQIKAFVYLGDVTVENGPFELIAGSHRGPSRALDMHRYGTRFKQYAFDDDEVERLLASEPERLRTVTGEAGTLILADTSAIHRGRPIEAGVRRSLTNYYYPPDELDVLYRFFAPTLRVPL